MVKIFAFALAGMLTGVITAPAFACADEFPYKTLIAKSGQPGTFVPVESFHSEAACQAAAQALSDRKTPPECHNAPCRYPVWCVPLACVDAPVNAAKK